MAVKISTGFVALVLPVILAENAYIGYNYHAPTSFPQQTPINLTPNLEQSYYNNVPQLHHFPAYNQHYSGGQQPQQTQHTFQHNNQGYHSAQNVNYNRITPSAVNGNLIGAQNLQPKNVRDYPAHRPSYTNTQSQQPIITKQIYFHLPPDEADNVAPVTPAPPKKTYNIIFIKLPSQKSTSAARLQQIINQQTAESKTLIYLLVQKPETRIVQSVTSKPEVFFVKYKSPKTVPLPVNNGLVQVPQSSIPQRV